MTFATVCSGIEAPSLAWNPLGWTAVFFAEIEKAACRVLAHHYPDVPNLGDMTKIDGAAWRGKVDVFFGGTPCQAFSVAGQRKSLDDDRGNLTLKFAELVHEIDPEFVVWENVPGVLSTPDNAFGCFLAGLVGADAPLVSACERGRWPHAGMVAGPARTAAWRILNAEHFGVAQRRYRVFLVSGRAGDFRCAQILFESASLRGDTAPRRKKGEDVAGTIGGGSEARVWNSNLDTSGAFIPVTVGAVSSKWAKGSGGPAGDECQNLVAVEYIPEKANTVTSNYASNRGSTGGNNGGVVNLVAVAFKQRPEGDVLEGDKAFTISSSSNASAANTPKVMTIQSFNSGGMLGDGEMAFETDTVRCVDGFGGFAPNQGGNVVLDAAVRRLTPREVERLFGMPDDYTLVPGVADSLRYRVLGNSIVVPVLAWIGTRISAAKDRVDAL